MEGYIKQAASHELAMAVHVASVGGEAASNSGPVASQRHTQTRYPASRKTGRAVRRTCSIESTSPRPPVVLPLDRPRGVRCPIFSLFSLRPSFALAAFLSAARVHGAQQQQQQPPHHCAQVEQA
jgi:hypothetical protein